jgi:hypothetical protein
MEGDEPASELVRPLIFDAEQEQRPSAMTPMPRAVQAVQDRDAEDVWAELG